MASKHVQQSSQNRLRCPILQVLRLFVLVAVFASCISSSLAWGSGLSHDIIQADTPQNLSLIIGKSIVLISPKPIKRASLASADLAEVVVLSPKQLYIRGLVIGATNLILWGRDGKIFSIYDVMVGPDIIQLKRQIHELFPKEKDVQVSFSQDFITLSGFVSGPEILSKILDLSESYAPKKVKNLLQVSGVQQVMLEVKIAEMAKGLLRRLGVNFTRQRLPGEFNFQIGTLDDLSTFNITKTNTIQTVVGSVANLSMGFEIAGDLWDVIIAALKQHDLTKILAEPTLITISGQEATFLAGGEFPIPVPQAFGVTTIKFKSFGVSLSFMPTVMSDGKIALKIAPEVSELDFANGVSSQGLTIPAIITRKVQTVVELKDGQSFAVAGLLQDNVRETVAKYPILGDIPILGTLFRSTRFQKNETELIIIITAHLVKPLDMKKQTLPTDSFLEPNDFEQMLMGYMEGRRHTSRSKKQERPDSDPMMPVVPAGGGFEGQFGHLAP